MENLHPLIDWLPPSSAVDASDRFDKQALLEIHDLARHQLDNIPEDIFLSDFTEPIGSSGAASSVPLERLNPISLTQLQVDQVHLGRVLYGTICAEAFRVIGAITTLLEDNNGYAVKLIILNVPHSQTNNKTLYPRGAMLAIRDPCFVRASDGGAVIRIDNSANVEMNVTQKEKLTESQPHVDAEELRKKGNICFRKKRWDAAAEHYAKCIDAALLHPKNSGSSNDINSCLLHAFSNRMDTRRQRKAFKKALSKDINTCLGCLLQAYSNDINTCLLHAYSNRAETRIQLNEFQLALEDSNEALQIDSDNVKALYRKGRALVGLGEFVTAFEYLQKAEKAEFVQKEMQDAYHEAKALYISNSLLGLAPAPEVPDFFGAVEIKMMKYGRGRGLYATRDISTGNFLLISNAVAFAYEDNERSARWARFKGNRRGHINLPSQEDLIVAVFSAASRSQRLLQQLYNLDDYNPLVSLDVPATDLFMTEGQMSLSPAAGKEKLQVDVKRIRDIISWNSFGGAEQTFPSKSKIYKAKLVQRDHNFSGLWLLPSFINHSCLPNSTRIAVGSSMFIHASKPIKRGEEITVSYFDTLVPLLQRQAMCNNWAFMCNCRRCNLELSLKVALKPITERFQQLHDKALDETNAARSQEHFGWNLPICAEFAKIFVEAEEIIRSSTLLKAEEERNWIRASFVSAYLAGTQSNDFYPTTLTDCVPSREEVMKAVQNTVPGDIRTLVMAARHLKEANQHESEAFRQYASEQAWEACIRVFGRHNNEGVTKALVLQHSNCYLF